MAELTAVRLRELLDYDPLTGVFRWRVTNSPRIKAGTAAGWLRRDRYMGISVDGSTYVAHRLAWLHVFGQWPSELDHKNGDRADNRLENLRIASRRENMGNIGRCKVNTSGFKSVHRRPHGRWQARISVEGRRVSLGHFDTKEEAHAAYAAAATQVYGAFARA